MVWLQGLLCGAMVTLATPTALLLGVLLGPALLAIAAGSRTGTTARTQHRAVQHGGGGRSAADAVDGRPQHGRRRPHCWAICRSSATAWSAAAGGWLLAEVMPIAVRAALEALSIARAARLRAERSKLVEAWGLESPPADQ